MTDKFPSPSAQGRNLISIFELLQETWDLYKKLWQTTLVIALIGILIQVAVKRLLFKPFAVYVVSASSVVSSYLLFSKQSPIGNILFYISLGVIFLIIWTIVLLIAFWMETAIVYAIRNYKEGKTENSVATALKQSWQALGPISIISLLTSLVTFLGFIFLILPGVFLIILLQFSALSYVTEGKTGFSALKYSLNLVLPKFWSVLLRNVIIFGLVFIIGIIFNKGIWEVLRDLLLTPFVATYLYLLYRGLDVQKTSILT